MLKATREHTKNHNTRLVLRTIYEAQSVSRADIARSTGLTRPTVSSIVADLIDEHLVREAGTGPSAGGKPPVMLEINHDGWHVLSLDIGNDEFHGALVNLYGEIVERTNLPADNRTGEEAVQLLFDLVEQLYAASDKPLIGIGVGSPGLIDPTQGIIRHSVNLGWRDVPLRARLAERFEDSIYLANDSQAAALGEFMFGEPRDSEHLLLIRMVKGIGAGIVMNSALFYGDGFGAGEIGHIVMSDDHEGKTFEMRASSTTLLKKARQHTGSDLTWREFINSVEGGDPALTQIVQDSGRVLGVMVAHLIGTLNIHNVVISGPISEFGDLVLDPAREAASARTLPILAQDTILTTSNLNQDIVLLGCSALVLQNELGVI